MTDNNYKTKPLTLKTLEQYNKKILIPEVKEVVNERMQHYTNQILNDNDKVVKKLNQILTEQQAITVNYKRLDHEVENLITFAEQAAKKLHIEFERV